jgi:rod shape-determining protein MreD
MRDVAAIMLTAVVLVLLQTSVVPLVPLLPVVPDLLLVLTVWIGLRHHGIGGVCGAIALGYVLDTFSGTTLGVHMFALTAAYVSTFVLARTVWTEGGVSSVLVTFAAGCTRDLALIVAGALAGSPAAYGRHLMQYVFLDATAAAAVAPAVFAFVRWERRRIFRVAT